MNSFPSLAVRAFLLCLFAAPSLATEIIIGSVQPGVDPGTPEIGLVFLNDSAQALTLPQRLDATIVKDGQSTPVVLDLLGSPQTVAPGAFAKPVYRFALPDRLSTGGPVRIEMAGDMPASAAVILPAPTVTEAPPVELAAVPPDSRPEPDALQDSPQADGALNFSTYRPMYALLGTSPLNAKLQFSFKYALVDPDSGTASRLSFLRGIYFGYTQTMFWDLGVESSPFRSIDFQPELFYRYRSDLALASLQGSDVNVQAGVKHYSNGREEPFSRSFNTVYLEPSVSVPIGDSFRLTAAPRAFIYFGDLEDNPDIDEFRGHSGLRLTLVRDDGARLETAALGFIGTGRGSVQTDLSYPIKGGFLGDLNLRLHGQLFAGYGDNLFEYDRKSTRLRFGISLVP
ncbi:phospholipase A [Pacificimonas sp. ICDLI1SI03]